MLRSEMLRTEIMAMVRKSTVPQMRVLYATAYALVYGSRNIPAAEVRDLPEEIRGLLRVATSRELEIIKKCAAVILQVR